MKEITPTVGFNVEQFSRSGINFTVFDMSGAGKYRPLWEHYFKDANAIIFVIDCSDKLRMCRVKEELKILLEHPDTKGIPTLFFANKIDISDHLNPVECVQYLDLDNVKDRPWHITPSNALTGIDFEKELALVAENWLWAILFDFRDDRIWSRRRHWMDIRTSSSKLNVI
jgi:ADP-ribosylation factor-like protein 6